MRLSNVPDCQGPDPHPRAPRFTLPPGACDSHAHVIGPPERFPYVASRSYTPPPALEADYLAMHDALGIQRGVLVQVSVHGTDNSCMVESLRHHPERLRGVAVVGPDVSDNELADLHGVGVRGLRINTETGGGIGPAAMEFLARRIRNMGWHIQLLINPKVLAENDAMLHRLPVPFVIDHFGYAQAAAGVAAPGFQCVLRLLQEADCWVKISGANRISKAPIPYRDSTPLARALIATKPDRLVWGSDWPHVHYAPPMVNDGDLLDLLAEWAPDEATRKQILVDNPARLYGFPSP
jgi:predicted TIM-barrel fold metal-dependent hydrolase